MLGLIFSLPIFLHSLLAGSNENNREIGRKNICLPSTKEIAITFDDGPHSFRTNAILDTLKKERVPATFFVVGSRLSGQDKILRRMIEEGHTIGNHSYSHARLPDVSYLSFIDETLINDIRIWLHTGLYPKYFRFPYGLEDNRIHWLHFGSIIGWNVDAADWRVKNPKILIQKINQRISSGSIILLHDIKEDTMIALPELITNLKNSGYTFVSLDTLLHKKKWENNAKYVWRSATKKTLLEKSLSGVKKEE